MTRRLIFLLSLVLLVLFAAETTAQTSEPHRIGIRSDGGQAGFYDTVTGSEFTPRGVNYLEYSQTPRSVSENWLLATDRFNADAIRAALQQLAGDYQYNTVRIIFDACDTGSQCITVPGEAGLNPAYLDNLAALIEMAANEGIYLVLASAGLPAESAYSQLAQREAGPLFGAGRNADLMTLSGVEAARKYWEDVLTGLAARNAPLSAVLGWSLLADAWLPIDQPPLSLTEGTVTLPTGSRFDLASPEQQRAMVVEALTNYSAQLRGQIQALDPGALVTMGFPEPQAALASGRLVDTQPLLAAAHLDFFDVHADPGSATSIEEIAAAFGLTGSETRPVIMGEVGAYRERFPSTDIATVRLMDWIAESCAYGFDGWLIHDYYGPDSPGDYTRIGLLADGGLPLFSLSPLVQPDACVRAPVLVANVAFNQAAEATMETGDETAPQAVDGSADTAWNSGAESPQGLQIDFDQSRTISEIRLTVRQDSQGPALHRVWALREGTDRVLVGVLLGDTRDGQVIELTLPTPLSDVTGLQIATLESPSPAGWREIEAYEGNGDPICLATLTSEAVMRVRPLQTSRSLGPLAAGDQALIVSRVAGPANDWLGLPGGGYVRADFVTLDGACDALPSEAATRRSTVPVTFAVRVPTDTVGPVYLTGDFGVARPIWDPAGLTMENTLAAPIWTIRLELEAGATVEYKFTLGNWETVEKTASCEDLPNRTLVIGDRPMVVRDAVAAWSGTGACGS